MTLIIIAAILDFAIIKWRRLSSLIMPIELLFQLFISFVPSVHSTTFDDLFVLLINIMAFIIYYTIEPWQIVFSVINYFVWSFVPVVLIFKGELTFLVVLNKFCVAIGMFITTCLIAMSLVYIFQLQTKLRDLNVENIKLLDGMHEGLLILSKENKNVMFCNKPS